MESIKQIRRLSIFVIFLTLLGCLQCQEYDITLWGLPIGSAQLVHSTDGEIAFTLESHQLVENFYPINLDYHSKYNKTNYTILENNKVTKQGNDKQKFEATLTSGNRLVYTDRDSIKIESKTYSLLSLLAKITNSSLEEIDTKWFNLENEGILYKVRFLWNDSTIVSVNSEDIMCDHYRIDLKIIADDKRIFDKTDYFNDLFFDINSIRQIWVEKWQKQRRLVKIALKQNLINLNIAIKN